MVAAGVIAAMLAVACTDTGGGSAARRAAAPPIRFDSIRIASSEGDCADADSACARVDILYPLAESETHPQAADAIHQTVGEWLLGRPGDDRRSASPDTVAAQFISAFLEFRRENPTLKPRWSMTREVRVVLDTVGIVTLHGIQEDFDSRMHGTTNAFWASFSLATGRRLGVHELVAPADTARFTALVEAAFRRERGLDAAASLADAGFFSETGGRFALPDNIGLTRDSLVLHYNPSEVAVYAAGPTIVMLPWSTLKNLIRPDSPAHAFVRITTPLMTTGGEDHNVPALNSREMYCALRRLGKEVQWVNYVGGGHGIPMTTEAEFADWHRRVLGWFDRLLTAPAGAKQISSR